MTGYGMSTSLHCGRSVNTNTLSTSNGGSSSSANFQADNAIRSNVMKGSHNLEIGSHPGHAHFGVFYGPYAVGIRPLCLNQIWSR